MDFFYSTPKMKRYIINLKKTNQVATLMGLDVGRMLVGTSVSDRFLNKAKPLHTFNLKSGFELIYYPNTKEEFNLNYAFFDTLADKIQSYKVKGLVVGYPIYGDIPVNKFI